MDNLRGTLQVNQLDKLELSFGFTIGTDLDSSSGNLKMADSSGTIRSGTSSGQKKVKVGIYDSSLTFHNSSNNQVLQLVNSLSKTINIGGGLGGYKVTQLLQQMVV